MKTKLTLRLDDDVKERAKALAVKRGTSVSRLVEDYFRLLLGEAEATPGEGSDEVGSGDLPPRTKALKERLGRPAPQIDIDADTRAWIDAAAEKHA